MLLVHVAVPVRRSATEVRVPSAGLNSATGESKKNQSVGRNGRELGHGVRFRDDVCARRVRPEDRDADGGG